jgi:hypothetical protein
MSFGSRLELSFCPGGARPWGAQGVAVSGELRPTPLGGVRHPLGHPMNGLLSKGLPHTTHGGPSRTAPLPNERSLHRAITPAHGFTHTTRVTHTSDATDRSGLPLRCPPLVTTFRWTSPLM